MVLTQVNRVLLRKLISQQIGQSFVKVIPAKVVVASSRQHIHHPIVQLDERDVKRPAPQIIDQHAQVAVIPLAITIGQRRGGGFVNNALHSQPGNGASFNGRLALDLVKIRWHCDDGARDLLTQSALSSTFEGTQDQRRDLLGAVGRAGHTHGLTATHLALDGTDGAIGRHHPLVARGVAHQDFAAWRNAHDRGQQAFLTNGHKTHVAILDDTEDRIGRAEINPNDLPLLTHHGPPGAQWSPAAGRRRPAPRRLRHSATPAGAGDSPGAARG